MAMVTFGKAIRFIAAATLLLIAAGSASEATKADGPNEWCALYDKDGGNRNCSFETLEDCSAAVPVGKWCQLNPLHTSDSPARDAEPDRGQQSSSQRS